MVLLDMYNYFVNMPRYHIFFVVSIGYVVYYLMEVVKVSAKKNQWNLAPV